MMQQWVNIECVEVIKTQNAGICEFSFLVEEDKMGPESSLGLHGEFKKKKQRRPKKKSQLEDDYPSLLQVSYLLASLMVDH